jgi:hypothetical protein
MTDKTIAKGKRKMAMLYRITTQKTKDWATQIPQKTYVNSMLKTVNRSFSTRAIPRVILFTNFHSGTRFQTVGESNPAKSI